MRLILEDHGRAKSSSSLSMYLGIYVSMHLCISVSISHVCVCMCVCTPVGMYAEIERPCKKRKRDRRRCATLPLRVRCAPNKYPAHKALLDLVKPRKLTELRNQEGTAVAKAMRVGLRGGEGRPQRSNRPIGFCTAVRRNREMNCRWPPEWARKGQNSKFMTTQFFNLWHSLLTSKSEVGCEALSFL